MNKERKFRMGYISFIILISNLLFVYICNAQSIRKDYREMTEDEIDAYVDAIWDLWNNGDITDFENIHISNFTTIHRNEMFLPWHRVFVKEYEELLQAINPNLFIPYWDWTDDQSTNPAWNDNDFLGQFDGPLNLNRNLGAVSLPDSQDVVNTLNVTSFSSGGLSGNGFGGGQGSVNNPSQGDLEEIHNSPHVFIGFNSIMNSASSPRDPVFFFHHGFVDKIWQDWTGTSSFTNSSLPTPYTGINPHNIVDSRDLKVWYAESGEVLLDKYDTDSTEEYRYTGIINAEDNFVVKNSSSVTFIAGNKITLGPGFQVESGAVFSAEVDPGVGNILAKQVGATEEPLVEVTNTPEDYSLSQNYPNPFNPVTVIRYEVPITSRVELAVFDLLGRKVATLVDGQVSAGQQEVRFDASNLSSGIYIYRIRANDFVQTKQMTLIK